VERLRGEGLPVLDPDDAPGSLWRVRLEDLRDVVGDPVPVESWPQVEGAVVVVTTEWVYPDATSADEEDTDEPVRDGDAEPERGFVPVWIVPDPGAAGLHHRYDSGRHGGGTRPDEPSEAEREAASAERRRVIAHNKAWRSAETVRRDWLTKFIARKTVPTGAEALICEAILGCDHRLSTAMDKRHRLLRSLLGEGEDRQHETALACERLATDPKTAKAQTVRSLAAVLAAWEDSSGTHTWRNPTPWDARIIAALIGWGYAASPVERILIGEEPAASGQDAP
jgi:ParB family chromosome partitioning protein